MRAFREALILSARAKPTLATSLDGSVLGRIAFGIMIFLYLTYAGLFIYRTSFIVNGQRYFSLFDDAMIAMQYGRNLARGYGLVWNPSGDRVEGFTDPLWVVLMSFVHVLPLAASKTSLVVQIGGAALLAANLFFVRRIALIITGGSELISLGAVGLTATYLPLNFWALQGMEVSLLALVVSIALSWALVCLMGRRFSLPLYLLLGFSTSIRPDMVVPYVAFMLFLALADPANSKRHLMWGSLVLLCFAAAQTALRIWYFGNPLPNTYYLKLSGYPMLLRITRGMEVLATFAWHMNLLLFAIPFLLALRRDRRALLLLWVFTVQLLYSVYVGGDAWEFWGGSNRYISIAMPAFFILLACGLAQLGNIVVGILVSACALRGQLDSKLQQFCFVLLIAASVLGANCIYGSGALAELFLVRAPLHSGVGGENEGDVREALALSRMTTPQASLLVARAGTIPYFSGRVGIDLLGKNDVHIAHEPMHRSASGFRALVEFRPGHMKYDYGYSIGTLKPDVVVQLWQHQEEVQPYLAKYYLGIRVEGHCVYFRKDSTNVLWHELPPEPCSVLIP